MINNALINPKSIVIIGGSNDITKPGGKVLKNLIDGNFNGDLYVSNPKETLVQGIKSFQNIHSLPEVDLAIIAIAAKYIPETIEILTKNKNTRGFIILSAGFSEMGEEGKILEKRVVDLIDGVDGSLIGPNCIGVLNTNYNGVFSKPTPVLDPQGCDFISGSGATAVFILESAIPYGLTFSSVYSVGNSAQLGVEEILKYMDETFDPEKSSRIKILYMEKIDKPALLLKHASSLIRKGCKIAAIKSGTSEAGSRAASSHTGALASPDVAVEALFNKAGIVRCYGREDLISVANVFKQKELKGKNIAIITHAGGPAVMLTDALSKGGLNIPHIEGKDSDELLGKLFDGSSVGNPIDFLATGTAEQLDTIFDYTDNKFDNIDGMAVIFGTPGLFPIFDAYKVISERMKTSRKPIFPVFPSGITARKEVDYFLSLGETFFPDEVLMGNAICKVYNTPKPEAENVILPEIDKISIRKIIDNASEGYISPSEIQCLLDATGIPRAKEKEVYCINDATEFASSTGFPVVMKVVGPLHKSDVGGVSLNVNNIAQVEKEFNRLININEATGVLIQKMHQGTELFAGVKYEKGFGHLILCGLGGIFIEVLKDVSTGLAPLSGNEAVRMIKNLKGYKIISGVRGNEGVNEAIFADIIVRLSALVTVAPEIEEMDLNPLLGSKDNIIAVDARINVKKR
ncbi:MAG: acetate--CoA ligase family protein [Bacteroidota bacterium]|nr:acetate--CoA ligase family protein [Bacteroidota bacterium]